MARASIAAAAAVAAAWAFADSAEAGPPGLAAAPGVAAGAEATVMAFQAAVPLAVGAYDVPRDMHAYIHRGEMVVPQTFAAGLRSGDTNFGGSASVSATYAPTFHGAAGSTAVQASREFDAFKAFMWNMTRNGSLKLPGR
jgi:hypothetical protein